MQKKILNRNLICFIIFFFVASCSSVPKYPLNACKIFNEKYLWYKHAKKSSEIYGAPVHIILAFVNKESGFNRWAKPKRTKTFEKKFQIDQELKFKVEARSNKYLGEWAGSQLGKTEEEKRKYIQEIIKADMEEAGQEDVFRKVKKDFQTASFSIEDLEIRDQMQKALLRAKEDLK